MSTIWQKRAYILMGLLASGIVLFWGITRPPHFAIDDAYITYRYAENLRQGIGFVYNAGESVLGTTAPMYAMLLALLSYLVPDFVLLGHWFSILAWGGAALMTLPLLLKLNRPLAAAIAPVLIAVQPSILKSVGMETPFLLFMMLLVAWGWLDRHKKTAVVAGAIMLITRQDSALWLLVLGFAVWQQKKELPWREAVGVMALTLPWFAFAAWQYGSILPNSASAKIGQTNVMVVGSGIPFWQQFGLLLTEHELPLIGILVVVALLAWLLEAATSRQWTGWWLGVWVLGYTAVYSLLNVVNFNWYFVPPVAVTMLLAAIGLEAIYRWAQQLIRHQKWQLAQAGVILIALLFIPLIVSLGLKTWNNNQIPGVRADYFEIGRWLAENSEPEDTVATIEIGVIGYESKRPIVDTMGLVSSGMTNHQVGWVETLVYAVNTYSPRYLVTLPQTGWDALRPQWWFQAAYEPVLTLENAVIFQRKSEQEQIVQPVNTTLEGGLYLESLHINTQTPALGSLFDVWLKVQVQQPQPNDYQLTLFLVDAQHQQYAVAKDFPFGSNYNSSKWQAGDTLEIPIQLQLPADLPAGGYNFGIIMFDPSRSGGVPLAAAPEQLSPDIRAGWVRLGNPPRDMIDTAVSHQPQADWQNDLSLESVNIGESSNGMLPLQLIWRVNQPLTRDLTTFVHLLDEQGNILSQVDERPFQGQWPTTIWQPNETIFQTLYLPLPEDLSGIKEYRVGLYDGEGRLPLADGSADFWQEAIDLQAALP